MHDDDNDNDIDRPLGADEARLQAALEREARAYNAPPATAPRDLMWGEIRARLDAERAPVAVTPAAVTPVVVTPIAAAPSRRRGWTRHAAWGAIAAGALIAGVGLGRLTKPSAPPRPTDAASVPAAPSTVATAGPASEAPADGGPAEPAGRAPGATSTSPPSSVTRQLAVNAPRAAARAPEPSRAYHDAAAVHLAAAEALLVSLRAPGAAAGGDTAVASWAGDLLGTTRVLLDSPAARDPRTRHLLEDLELVLAQIARLRPDAPADGRGVSDRDLIDQAIRQRQMLTRLRAAGT